MKWILIALLFHVLAINARAHGPEFPPFVLINGEHTASNPVHSEVNISTDFPISHEVASGHYTVNEPISFAVEKEHLVGPIPNNLLNSVDFSWELGDGVTHTESSFLHTYTKPGSYIITLLLSLEPVSFTNSILIHVESDEQKFQIQSPTITINHQPVDTSQNQQVNLEQPVLFEIVPPSGDALIYTWSFGDGNTATGQSVAHRYDYVKNQSVVLRVQDTNGFLSDSLVILEHTPNVETEITVPPSSLFSRIISAIKAFFDSKK